MLACAPVAVYTFHLGAHIAMEVDDGGCWTGGMQMHNWRDLQQMGTVMLAGDRSQS